MIIILKSMLAIVFIRSTMEQGQINGWVVRLFWNAPIWIKKPLFDCLTCMTSIWGTLAFFLFSPEYTILAFVQFILPLGGLLFFMDCVLTFVTSGIEDGQKQSNMDESVS